MKPLLLTHKVNRQRADVNRRNFRQVSAPATFAWPTAELNPIEVRVTQPSSPAFRHRLAAARKVLVVDLGFLGDTVQAIPVLWTIKERCAGELHVVSTPLGSEVLRLAPCVDRIWTVELNRQKRTLSAQLELIRTLRQERFDIAVSFSGNDRNVILVGVSGADWRLVQEQGRRHFWDRWLVDEWVAMRSRDLPVFEQRRQVLAAAGVELAPPRFELRIATPELEWAERVMPAGAIHFSLNSAVPLKEWPVAHYAALIRRLAGMFPTVPLAVSAMANPREQARVQELLQSVAGISVTVLPTGLTIGQLAAALRRCRLHFGPDSGVMHLAAALGVPTVSLFREKGSFREWIPSQPGHEALLAPCACVDHYNAPCERTGEAKCLAGIGVETVAARMIARLRL